MILINFNGFVPQYNAVETIGNLGDNKSETIHFIFNKVIDGIDISKLSTSLYFLNAEETGDIVLLEPQVVGSKVTYVWNVGKNATAVKGKLQWSLSFLDAQTGFAKTTNVCKFKIGDAIAVEEVIDVTPTLFQQLVEACTAQADRAREAADATRELAQGIIDVQANIQTQLDESTALLEQSQENAEKIDGQVTEMSELYTEVAEAATKVAQNKAAVDTALAEAKEVQEDVTAKYDELIELGSEVATSKEEIEAIKTNVDDSKTTVLNTLEEVTSLRDESSTNADNAKASALAAAQSAKQAAETASGLESFVISKVDVLPTIGEERTMYLVPIEDPEGSNYYEEYLWFDDTGYEYIGNTKVDLSDYLTIKNADETYAKSTDKLASPEALTIINKNSSISYDGSESKTLDLSDVSGDQVYVGDTEPTSDNVLLWIDTNEDDDDEPIYGVYADDSDKLGGVEASEYATKSYVDSTVISEGAKNIFVGTTEELNALTVEAQQAIEMFVNTDVDYTDDETFVTSGELNKVIDGTTQVGDAKKLGGKSADSFYNLGVPQTGIVVANTSVHDYTDEGRYYIGNNVTPTLTDLPPSLMGINSILNLTVEKITSSRIRQTITRHNNETYWCTGSIGGEFNAWQRVAYTDNISNPNLLINGDFRVNQRNGYYVPAGVTCYQDSALTTGASVATLGYTTKYYSSTVRTFTDYNGSVWYCNASDCVQGYAGVGYSFDMWTSTARYGIVKPNTKGITFSASGGIGWLVQYQENAEQYLGEKATVSIKTSDGKTYSTSGTFPSALPSSGETTIASCTGDTFKLVVSIRNTGVLKCVLEVTDGNSVDVEYIKLELGTVATPFTPRPYGEELALCQRYLYINHANTSIAILPNYVGANDIYFTVPLPVTLRGVPTLIGNVDNTGIGGIYIDKNWNTQTGFTITVTNVTSSSVTVRANKTAHGLKFTDLITLVIGVMAGFSAEL